MTDSHEPRTEAGKRLLALIADMERLSRDGARIAAYVPYILAIEAEASAPAADEGLLRELREKHIAREYANGSEWPVTHVCSHDNLPWPCDTARLLAATPPRPAPDSAPDVIVPARDYAAMLRESELGAAWAAVEAVLPEGWHLHGVTQPGIGGAYIAWAYGPTEEHDCDRGFHHEEYPKESAAGETPAAALQALAARLSREP